VHCVACKGTGVCEHKRIRSRCVDCGGNQICEHRRLRETCIECGGARICEHRRIRNDCSICHPEGCYKNQYKKAAKQKHREFSISCEDFVRLVKASCVYCGRTPAAANGMGLDREDNAKGYILSNCVTCCETCNKMKLTMSTKEFLEHIALIYRTGR
jgi:hypothetical protein